MATYRAGEAAIGLQLGNDKVSASPNKRRLRRTSTFSYISERLEIIRIPRESRISSEARKIKRKRKRSQTSCLRHCFLVRCLDYFGSQTRREPTNESEGDDVEYGPVRYAPHSLSTLTRTTNFTKEELKSMYRTFKNECPTGILYEDTFKTIYSQFFPAGDANMYAHYLFNAFDINQEGFISFEDFVISLSCLLRGKFEEKLEWVFKIYDINHDGFITLDEMQDIVKSMYSILGQPKTGSHLPPSHVEHAERVFKKLDDNGDGYVTFNEFVEACSRDPSIMASMKIFEGTETQRHGHRA